MKKLKLFLIITTMIISLILLVSCNTENDLSSHEAGASYDSGSEGYTPALPGDYSDSKLNGITGGAMGDSEASGPDAYPDYEAGSESSEGATEDSVKPPDEETIPTPTKRPAGLITAGAWNDNENYEYWKKLFFQGDENSEIGKFFYYSGDNSWGFSSLNRIKVTVKCDDNAVAGASVYAKDANNNLLFTAVSDANGIAYVFTDSASGTIEAVSSGYCSSTAFTSSDSNITLNLEGSETKKNIIEIMFVVDVTGSMGDELSYLKNEVADVVSRVAANNTEAEIYLALLFYRDTCDSELYKYCDFISVTEDGGIERVIAEIDKERASGGGDYPEAVDTALDIAVNKQWSSGATTKLIFHILDAPPHASSKNQQTFKAATNKASEKGIRICPIICSGADSLTEYLMRQAAIYTGGTFIFVTDDSGIGNSHHDPELPNVTVEALNSLMVRLINGYHTGEFADPIDWRQEINVN